MFVYTFSPKNVRHAKKFINRIENLPKQFWAKGSIGQDDNCRLVNREDYTLKDLYSFIRSNRVKNIEVCSDDTSYINVQVKGLSGYILTLILRY